MTAAVKILIDNATGNFSGFYISGMSHYYAYEGPDLSLPEAIALVNEQMQHLQIPTQFTQHDDYELPEDKTILAAHDIAIQVAQAGGAEKIFARSSLGIFILTLLTSQADFIITMSTLKLSDSSIALAVIGVLSGMSMSSFLYAYSGAYSTMGKLGAYLASCCRGANEDGPMALDQFQTVLLNRRVINQPTQGQHIASGTILTTSAIAYSVTQAIKVFQNIMALKNSQNPSWNIPTELIDVAAWLTAGLGFINLSMICSSFSIKSERPLANGLHSIWQRLKGCCGAEASQQDAGYVQVP